MGFCVRCEFTKWGAWDGEDGSSDRKNSFVERPVDGKVSHRPNLERTTGRSFGLVWWKAVATLPRSTPVCALVPIPR